MRGMSALFIAILVTSLLLVAAALAQHPDAVVWEASYWNNVSLSGEPVLTRTEEVIDHDWGLDAPGNEVSQDNFSARWRRTIDVQEGDYRFRVLVDDGARLWVDDNLLIDAWQPQPPTFYEVDISLNSGDVPLRLEYYENGDLAQIALQWLRRPDAPPAPTASPTAAIPPPATGPPSSGDELTVDNDSDEFLRGGRPVDDWQEEATGLNGAYLWTYNSERLPTAYNWGQWQPDLEPGLYEVSVYIPAGFPLTTQARYWIGHEDGPSLVTVDQAANQERWLSFGTFYFDGTNNYLSLADLTFEDGQSSIVAYDAARWTPLDPGSP